jgi:NADPH:quinone reductase-like Zn-dependent oxidoreductase
MMQAMVIDHFGGVEALTLRDMSVPQIKDHEILMRVHVAGVGTWDPFEREGGYANAVPNSVRFPYVLGSEGAGIVQRIGSRVKSVAVGDRVYAASFLNPKGGFYAEYVALDADLVSHSPDHLTMEQAGVFSGAGITALRGLDDVLKLRAGETVLIFGAVASGQDGVALAQQLGADHVVDGRTTDVLSEMKAFSPHGLDAALLTAGGERAEKTIAGIHSGGRVAFPNGVDPVPAEYPERHMLPYNGEPDGEIMRSFDKIVKAGLLTAHVAGVFPLEHAQEAHRSLTQHYVGKLALRVTV